ncbi:MAG: B12-binding domain-containing radical SAM protein, partial [Gammaproteobacteria bacterium]|nr:B12-binding domain-containing radical SAM protein [Gammaproteobacteria bacterium]
MQQTEILLTTLNARYMHSAFALRYLYANLADYQARAAIQEFTIHERAIDIAEKLLDQKPAIIAFSVYIWNIEETTSVVGLIKQIQPDIKIVAGGPEVSFAGDLPALAELVDYIITGPGEKSFYRLCHQLLSRQIPLNRVIAGEATPLDELHLPYRYYNDEDIRNRLIYVEASRGCPFKCEFCLSALDKTAKPFELTRFLDEMEALHNRGARNFKFIDRTFNLKVSSSVAILEFFLERMSDDLYLHFEVIPDQLPDLLKKTLAKFPRNSLQFEIGVQTFDREIQSLISRKQDNDKTSENLTWLRENTGAHIHADLIFGLPGDSLENFAESFNQLIGLGPQEIQLGILKRLRGAPINRHTDTYQ